MPSDSLPPGPRTPALWQLLRFGTDFIGTLEACARRYGDVFTVAGGPGEKLVVATGPADAQAIMTDGSRFAGGDAARLVEPITGPASVIIASGEAHMRQRRLLLPPFHGEQVARWTERIADLAETELERLPTGAPMATRPAMQRITLAVICRLVFGIDDAARLAQFSAVVTEMMRPRYASLLLMPTLLRRGGRLSPARPFLRARAAVHALVFEEIARRRADPLRAERDDILSLLIEARNQDGRAFSDAQLRDELMGLLVAGHETTATGLSWALERLSRTPRVRERLDAELADGGRAYLDAVVRETLRCRPPVIDAIRSAAVDTELRGYRIPRGTLVSAMFCITHRRADLWQDPLAFRPERFLEGKLLPYSYTPFGGGVRRCLGASLATLELNVVLERALRRFSVESAGGPEERIRLAGITLIPAQGGRVMLRPRPQMPRAPVAAAPAATATR